MMRKILSLVLVCMLALGGLCAFAAEDGEWSQILLLGEYGVANDGPVPTEAMMVLYVNYEARQFKLALIDSAAEAEYDGTAATLADANVYGGAELAVKTVNEAYGLNIEDYIQISMADLTTVIDLVGGVDLTITESELAYINEAYFETPLETAGLVHMNGLQAVRHAINGGVGEGSYAFMRGPSVLLAMGVSLQNLDAGEAMGLGDEILPLVRTSMERDAVRDLVKTCLIVDLENVQIGRSFANNVFLTLVEAKA